MSIEIVAWYLDQSKADGPRLLALLSLAERANELGTCCPGMASIARRLRRSERTAQTIISDLEQAGELLVVPGAGVAGIGGHTPRYYLLSYIKAHGIEIPAEHIEASLLRDRQRENGAKGQKARKSPNKGVQKPSPLNGGENQKGAQEPSPVDAEKRGEGLRKGVKVSAERGEGFDAKGVQKPSPKPTTEPLTTKPTTNSNRAKQPDGTEAPDQPPAAEANPPAAQRQVNAFGRPIDGANILLDDLPSGPKNLPPEPLPQSRGVNVGIAQPGQLVREGTGKDAYWVFREYFTRSLTEYRINLIRRDVSDIPKWRKVCERWAEVYGNDWYKFGLLDWYRDGIPGNGAANGKSKSSLHKNGATQNGSTKVNPLYAQFG